MTTGETIGMMAKQKGFNLRQLAAKAEVPYNTLYAIVKRKSSRIDGKTLRRIADALEVSIDELEPFTPKFMHINEHEHEDWIVDPRFNAVITTRMIDADTKEARKAAKNDVLRLLKSFDTLDEDGQRKAIEFIEILAKVPDYHNPAVDEERPSGKVNGEIFADYLEVQTAERIANIHNAIFELFLACDATDDPEAYEQCIEDLIEAHENTNVGSVKKIRVRWLRKIIDALIAAHNNKNEEEEHKLIAELIDTYRPPHEDYLLAPDDDYDCDDEDFL